MWQSPLSSFSSSCFSAELHSHGVRSGTPLPEQQFDAPKIFLLQVPRSPENTVRLLGSNCFPASPIEWSATSASLNSVEASRSIVSQLPFRQ